MLRVSCSDIATRRLEAVVDNVDRFGFTMADANSNEIITEQKGVFRTNCLDWYMLCFLLVFLSYELIVL